MAIPVSEEEMEVMKLLAAAGTTVSTKLAEKILDKHFETRDAYRDAPSFHDSFKPLIKSLSDYKEVIAEAVEPLAQESRERKEKFETFQRQGASARTKFSPAEKATWHEMANGMPENFSRLDKARRIARKLRYEESSVETIRKELAKIVGKSL